MLATGFEVTFCEFVFAMILSSLLFGIALIIPYMRKESRENTISCNLLSTKRHEGGADVRKKRTFTVKVEFTPDAIPIEKALDSLARNIAREMYEARHKKETRK